MSPALTAVILTRGCLRRGIWAAVGYQNTNTVRVRALSLGVTYSWEKLVKAKETSLELAHVMHLRVCRSLSSGLCVRGCLAHVLHISFYLIIKFYAKKRIKKLCKEESRCILHLSSSLPRLLAQSWSRGFVFPSILLLQWGFTVLPLPLQARAQLEPEHDLLSTCIFLLSCLKCLSCGRGNCCFSWVKAQLKQEPSDMRTAMFEPGHAGNCSQQGVIFFWNLLPTWGLDISASPVLSDGMIAEVMWGEDPSLWWVSADLIWALVCHLLCFGLAVNVILSASCGFVPFYQEYSLLQAYK